MAAMINSFGTEADGEADGSGGSGSGRKRRQLFGCSAVRLFGCSGCSAVRAVRLFGCSAVRAVRAAAALLPRMEIGERQRSPHRSRSQQLSFSCAVVFVAVAYRRQRLEAIPPTRAKSTDEMVVVLVGHQRRGLSSPAWPAASGSEAPTAAGDSSSNSSFLFLVLLFLWLSPIGGSGWKPSHRRRQNPPLRWLCWWCWCN